MDNQQPTNPNPAPVAGGDQGGNTGAWTPQPGAPVADPNAPAAPVTPPTPEPQPQGDAPMGEGQAPVTDPTNNGGQPGQGGTV